MNLILNRSLKQLLWIGIGSILMFFAGLTSAYVVRKPQGNWVEFILPDWFLYSTKQPEKNSLVAYAFLQQAIKIPYQYSIAFFKRYKTRRGGRSLHGFDDDFGIAEVAKHCKNINFVFCDVAGPPVGCLTALNRAI